MDVTLAMVKQSCGTYYVPHAMMSGLILSLLTPPIDNSVFKSEILMNVSWIDQINIKGKHKFALTWRSID